MIDDKYKIDCTGDVVCGDVIRFTEAVFSGSFSRFHRRSRYLGERTIEARVVGESYGASKQQHTFSLEVIASTGADSVEAGTTIRRKGRNVYRRGTYRQPWEDETQRCEVQREKHSRGTVARLARAERMATREGGLSDDR